jgi:hypothetical protein
MKTYGVEKNGSSSSVLNLKGVVGAGGRLLASRNRGADGVLKVEGGMDCLLLGSGVRKLSLQVWFEIPAEVRTFIRLFATCLCL